MHGSMRDERLSELCGEEAEEAAGLPVEVSSHPRRR
jgi:hypothetical protein